MRSILPSLPILLVALSAPALALPPDAPSPASRHLIQSLRAGNGQPRVRDASASRVAARRTLDQADGTHRSRPYRVAQPGEGEPKS